MYYMRSTYCIHIIHYTIYVYTYMGFYDVMQHMYIYIYIDTCVYIYIYIYILHLKDLQRDWDGVICYVSVGVSQALRM